MKQDIKEIELNLEKYIELLVNGEEKEIVVTKNNQSLLKMTPYKNSKRVGSAKKEMNGFDISLEQFNSIPTFEI